MLAFDTHAHRFRHDEVVLSQEWYRGNYSGESRVLNLRDPEGVNQSAEQCAGPCVGTRYIIFVYDYSSWGLPRTSLPRTSIT